MSPYFVSLSSCIPPKVFVDDIFYSADSNNIKNKQRQRKFSSGIIIPMKTYYFYHLLIKLQTLSYIICGLKSMFFLLSLKHLTSLIWGRFVYNGLISSLSLHPIKYLKARFVPFDSFWDITILSISTLFIIIDCLSFINLFLLTPWLQKTEIFYSFSVLYDKKSKYKKCSFLH